MKKKSKNKIAIYISTYGKKIYKCGLKHGIPIEVGATQRNKNHECKYSVQDNYGENISTENPYYGELTALYWIWKNTDSTYIGLYHYNK